MFNGSFAISQGTDVTKFTISDNSTGSDPNLTGRTIYLYQSNGELLGGSAINWPLSDGSTKEIELLTKDYSLSINVVWASISPLPSPSTYTLTSLYTFTGNTNAFIYGIIQQLAAQPNLSNDTNFYDSLSKIQTDLDCAVQANTYGDQFSAQFALDRCYSLIVNESMFF